MIIKMTTVLYFVLRNLDNLNWTRTYMLQLLPAAEKRTVCKLRGRNNAKGQIFSKIFLQGHIARCKGRPLHAIVLMPSRNLARL